MALCPATGHQYLPLCGIPARLSRDGYSGPNAHIYIPFANTLYFFSGATVTFPSGEVPQDRSRIVAGNNIPGHYTKGFDCCACSPAGESVSTAAPIIG